MVNINFPLEFGPPSDNGRRVIGLRQTFVVNAFLPLYGIERVRTAPFRHWRRGAHSMAVAIDAPLDALLRSRIDFVTGLLGSHLAYIETTPGIGYATSPGHRFDPVRFRTVKELLS